jgi:DNA-binding NarL/FixJ family response regulator
MESIRIVIADDHVLMRQGLRSLLERRSEVTFVGEAHSTQEMLRLLERSACDVLLVEMEIDGRAPVRISGDGCVAEVKKRFPQVSILVVTAREDESEVLRALRDGADGYIIKSATFDELVQAISDVSQGRSYLHPRVAGAVVRGVRGAPARPTRTLSLSPREGEILRMLAQGKSVKEICQELVLSKNTIKTHLTSLYRKLAVTDRTRAVLVAVRLGLLPPLHRPEDDP